MHGKIILLTGNHSIAKTTHDQYFFSQYELFQNIQYICNAMFKQYLSRVKEAYFYRDGAKFPYRRKLFFI
jgi:calcineurin-like phosphoesterase family protein